MIQVILELYGVKRLISFELFSHPFFHRFTFTTRMLILLSSITDWTCKTVINLNYDFKIADFKNIFKTRKNLCYCSLRLSLLPIALI